MLLSWPQGGYNYTLGEAGGKLEEQKNGDILAICDTWNMCIMYLMTRNKKCSLFFKAQFMTFPHVYVTKKVQF